MKKKIPDSRNWKKKNRKRKFKKWSREKGNSKNEMYINNKNRN